jgi:HAMP domain-containing protein
MTENVASPVKPLAFISLRLKLLVGFTVVFSVVFAGAYLWFYQYSTERALNRIRQDLEDTLRGTIHGVNGNDFQSLAREGKADASGVPSTDPRYLQHQTWLDNVVHVEPRAIAYTYVLATEPDTVLWVGDSSRTSLPHVGYEPSKFLDAYTPGAGSVILQGLKTDTINMEGYADDWGKWVSGYGPIKNDAGEIVGAVGIDFDATYVVNVQEGIRNSMVASFGITYGTLFLLVFLISRVFTRPIANLTKAAERIGEGQYDQDLTALHRSRFPDEIASLAQVFEIMVGKVYQREQALLRQVEELKIEVDESKRQKQVSEIVDSGFFQDLREKAREMRERRKDKLDSDVPDA